MSLNGIMINVSEAEYTHLMRGIESLLANLSNDPRYRAGTERDEIADLLEELCEHKATFNPETELAAKQYEEIQHLNAIIQNHENEAQEYRFLLRKSAVYYKRIGSMVTKNSPSEFSDGLDKACRKESEEIALHLYNSARV